MGQEDCELMNHELMNTTHSTSCTPSSHYSIDNIRLLLFPTSCDLEWAETIGFQMPFRPKKYNIIIIKPA